MELLKHYFERKMGEIQDRTIDFKNERLVDMSIERMEELRSELDQRNTSFYNFWNKVFTKEIEIKEAGAKQLAKFMELLNKGDLYWNGFRVDTMDEKDLLHIIDYFEDYQHNIVIDSWKAIVKTQLIRNSNDFGLIQLMTDLYNVNHLTWDIGNQKTRVQDMSEIEIDEALKVLEGTTKNCFIRWKEILNKELVKFENNRIIEKLNNGTLTFQTMGREVLIQDMTLAELDSADNYLSRNGGVHKNLWRDIFKAVLEGRLERMKEEFEEGKLEWPSTDGPTIVQDMNIGHLRNCLNRVSKKNNSFNKFWHTIFTMEQKRRDRVEDEKAMIRRAENMLNDYRNKRLYWRSPVNILQDMDLDNILYILSTEDLSGDLGKVWKDIFELEIGRRDLEKKSAELKKETEDMFDMDFVESLSMIAAIFTEISKMSEHTLGGDFILGNLTDFKKEAELYEKQLKQFIDSRSIQDGVYDKFESMVTDPNNLFKLRRWEVTATAEVKETYTIVPTEIGPVAVFENEDGFAFVQVIYRKINVPTIADIKLGGAKVVRLILPN